MTNKTSFTLKAVEQEYRQGAMKLMSVKLLAFAGQISCFWVFSVMMFTMLVEQQPIAQPHLYWFLLFALIWVLTRHIAISFEHSLNTTIESNLLTKLNDRLNTEQHLLAKSQSVFSWQKIYLEHIPALALYISQYVTQKYLAVLLPLLVLIVLTPVNWFVTLVLILTLPLVPTFMILVGHKAANLHRKHFVSLERLGGLFIDRLKALTLLSTFNQHDKQQDLLHQSSQVVNRQTMKVVSVAFLSNTVLDFFSTVAMALVAVYIGFTLLGEINLGPELNFQLGLFLLLVAPLLFSELKTLGRLYHQKAKAEAAFDVLMPVLNKQNVATAKEDFTGFQWLNFQIHQPELHAKQLILNTNDKVLLTGQSGSGKSTLLSALMGLKNSSHLCNVNSVLVGQKPVIMPGSVRDNLQLDKSLTEQQLWDVLAKVELTETIKRLPNGLNTKLGEHPPLSGGEAQRLCLARALLQDVELVLLDEPTAHLTETQHRELTQLICELCSNKTVIWASHKPLSTDWFNKQWQIEGGEITCK